VNNTIIINDLLMNYVKYFLTDKEQIVAVLNHSDDWMRNIVVDNYRIGCRSSGKHYRTLPIFTGHVRWSDGKTEYLHVIVSSVKMSHGRPSFHFWLNCLSFRWSSYRFFSARFLCVSFSFYFFPQESPLQKILGWTCHPPEQSYGSWYQLKSEIIL